MFHRCFLQVLSFVGTEVLSPFVLVAGFLAALAWRYEQSPWVAGTIVVLLVAGIPQGISIWMARQKMTTDRFIVRREQRHRFYALTLVSVLGGLAYGLLGGTSAQMRLGLLFALGTLVSVMAINAWFKISVHAVVAAFTTAAVGPVLGRPLLDLLLLPVLVLVPWSRVWLHRHSVPEVVCGLGFGLFVGAVFASLLD